MIKVDLQKAKEEIAHPLRRADRDVKMQPLDVKATIPSEATQAELDRQTIREENAIIQEAIDTAVDEVELKQVLINSGLVE